MLNCLDYIGLHNQEDIFYGVIWAFVWSIRLRQQSNGLSFYEYKQSKKKCARVPNSVVNRVPPKTVMWLPICHDM